MNRQQLVDAVGERLGDRRTAAVAVEAVLDTVTGALAEGERVALFGFGVFERVDRAARTARNPATGGTVEVPATAVPRFRAGQALKDAVNGRPSGASASTRRTGAAGATGAAAPPKPQATGGSKSEEEPKAAERGAGKDKAARGGAKDKTAKDKTAKDKTAKSKGDKDKGKAGKGTAKAGRSAVTKGASGKAGTKG